MIDSSRKGRCSQPLLGEHGKITYALIALALLATVMLFLFASSATFSQTTAEDFNSSNAYDFNYTKVTSDNNVMPDGEISIPSADNPPSGLVSYWRLDTFDGNVAVDSSGQGNTGTWQNGADSNSSWFFDTNAGFFDGVDDYIEITDNDSLSFGDGTNDSPFSVSCWIKQAAADVGVDGLVAKFSADGYEWYLRIINGQVGFGVSDTDADSKIRWIDNSIADNTWHHVVGTYDGSETVAGIKIYVDGSIVASSTSEQGDYGGMSNTAADVWIGRFSSSALSYNGSIAQVKIYNRALNPTEIATEYNRNLDGNGLLAYYTFNDTNSDDSGVIDYAGYDNNCSLVGGADTNAFGMWDTNAGFFDGVNDYINVSSQDNVMGISTALTEEAWVKFPQVFDLNSNEDFVLLDAGSHKLFFDSTSGKLSLEAVNQTQGSWSTSYSGDQNRANALAVYDGNLYAGQGWGTGFGDVLTFDGTTWSISYDGDKATIISLTVYDGNLYAGQGFGAGDGNVLTIDGTTWSTSYNGDQDGIFSLTVYDGNLFAGQGYSTGDGNVLTFDGTTWSISYDGDQEYIASLATYDGNLYAGQAYGTGDGDVLTFDGTTWSTSYNGDQEGIFALATYDGNLFAGVGQSTGDGNVLTFDGTTWSTSYDGEQEEIFALAVYDGNLYAGQGVSAGDGDVLTFDGTTWSTIYDGDQEAIHSLAVYDGNLFAGQGFTEDDDDVLTFGNGFSVSTSQNIWNAAQWYHIAATFDGSTARLYVNGEQDGSRSKSMTIDNLQNNRFSKKAFIGRATGTRQAGINESFHAAVIDELRIYNTALSAAEIAADYNSWMQSHYYSKVFDANSTAHWEEMSWTEFTDVNNTLTVDYRSCDDASCIGDSWTTGLWGGSTTHTLSTANNRYFQYRVSFDTNKTSWNAERTGDADKGSYAKFTNADINYNYAPDVNVVKIDGYADDGLPAFSYVQDGNLTIDFNVMDLDTNSLLIDINYSSSNTEGTGTKLLDDFNIVASDKCDDLNFTNTTKCSWDFNIHSSLVGDGNYFILIKVSDGTGTDFNASDNNFMVDNTAPSTIADYNNSWQNVDANVTFTCTDANSGCSQTGIRLDTDDTNSVTYGSWITNANATDLNAFFTTDGNWAVDFNSTDAVGNIEDTNTIYLLVDQTTPIVTITSPSSGYNTSGPPQFILIYTSTEPNVKKYWVRIDSGNWIDNGSNTRYTFAVSSENTKAYTLSVKLQDLADNNSAAASVSVMFVRTGDGGDGWEVCGNDVCGSGENCSNCPRDCGTCITANCADLDGIVCEENEECDGDLVSTDDADYCCIGKCIPKEGPEPDGVGVITTLLEKKISYSPTEKELDDVIKKAGVAALVDSGISWGLMENFNIARDVEVIRITDPEMRRRYKSLIRITVTNRDNTTQRNLSLIESIPKEIAESSFEISTLSQFVVIREDPVIEFLLPDLEPDESYIIDYNINKQLTSRLIAAFMSPIPNIAAEPVKVTMLSSLYTFTPTKEEIKVFLGEIGITDEKAVQETIRVNNLLLISRGAQVIRTEHNQTISYETVFKIKIKNNSNQDINNLSITEFIPAEITDNLDDINCLQECTKMEEDSAILFIKEKLAENEEITIEYSINAEVKPEIIEDMRTPLVMGKIREEEGKIIKPPIKPDYTGIIILIILILLVGIVAGTMITKELKQSPLEKANKNQGKLKKVKKGSKKTNNF